MIGRAGIEGSKSNVVMTACAETQASYRCGLLEEQASSIKEIIIIYNLKFTIFFHYVHRLQYITIFFHYVHRLQYIFG